MKNKLEVKKIDKRSKEYRDAHRKSAFTGLKIQKSKSKDSIVLDYKSIDNPKSLFVQVKELQEQLSHTREDINKVLDKVMSLETKVG